MNADVERLLKQHRYQLETQTLLFTAPEEAFYRNQIAMWTRQFSDTSRNGGLPVKYLTDPQELTHLTAFFGWPAWAAVAERPGKPYSYTSNFPYEPLVGNLFPGGVL